VSTLATNSPVVPASDDEFGAFGLTRIDRGNRVTGKKSVPVPLCPLQISHDVNWDRARAAAVGSRRVPDSYGTAVCIIIRFIHIKSPFLWRVTWCSLVEFSYVSEQGTASIFMVDAKPVACP
jgi:hypothetical protein